MEDYNFTRDDLINVFNVVATKINPPPKSKLDHFLSGAIALAAVLIEAGTPDLNAEFLNIAKQICEQADIDLDDTLSGCLW